MMVGYSLLVTQRVLIVVWEKTGGMVGLGLFLRSGRVCLLDKDQVVRFSRDGSSRGGWSDGFRLFGEEEQTCSRVRWLSAVVAVGDGYRSSLR